MDHEIMAETMKPGEWGTRNGKPAIVWYRPGVASRGEPSVFQEVRTYASEEERFDAHQRGFEQVVEKVRFGQILVGQDFYMDGSDVLFRRTKGRFAAPVPHIGGHVSGHSSIGFPFDLGMEVERVATGVIETSKSIDRPRGG